MMLYSWLGIDTNNSLFSYIRRHTFISASWVKYNLVDGLWLLSFLLLIEAVWNKDMKRKMTFMLPVIAFAFASEVFQYMGLISGTGDIWDTIFYVLAILLCIGIITLKTKIYEKDNN